MSLCPEADKRQKMTDSEFWQHTLGQQDVGLDILDDPGEQEENSQFDPCAICGELGPCAYDDYGRPMLHIEPEDKE